MSPLHGKMRGIDRTSIPVPSCLDADDVESRGSRELAKNIDSLSEVVGGTKTFKFTVYSSEEIKTSFRSFFHSKCAYCESPIGGTQPVDIEHYRPKGKVKLLPEDIPPSGESELPGYWWLAADWENLLPSCIDCNRCRKHPAYSRGESGPVENRQVDLSGKHNYFPLADESKRVQDHSVPITGEEPLLLNPCDHSDEDLDRLLRFEPDGTVSSGKERVTEFDRRQAEVSIQIYGLNRLGLVIQRREVLRQMREIEFVIKQLAVLLEEETLRSDANLKGLLIDLIHHEAVALDRFSDRGRPYSAMARQEIERFKAELSPGERSLLAGR